MSESRFDPNDPRLTAFVLGELDDTERAAVERQLEECAQSREAVAEIRNLTGLLSEQLPSEPAPALTEVQRETVVAAAEKVAVSGTVTPIRRRSRWVFITAVSTIAAAGLLLALSPDFRSEIQKASKYYSTPSGDNADYDDLLAFNESFEEDSKEALQRELALSEESFGVRDRDESRSRMRRTVKAGETADYLSVENLTFSAGREHFETSAKQFSNKAGRTNAESIVGNVQSTPSQDNFYYSPVTGKADATKPASGKSGSTQTSGLNIANQPARALGFPAQIADKRQRFGRDAKSKPALGQTLAAPNASDSSRSRNLQLGVTPRVIVQQSEKKPALRLKQIDVNLAKKIAPGSNSAARYGEGLMRGRAELPTVKDFSQLEIRNGVVTKRRVLGDMLGKSIEAEIVGGGYGAGGGGFGAADEGFAAGAGFGGGGIKADFQSLKSLIITRIESDDQNNTESYAPIIENEFLSPLKAPLSTFGIDVDTAAYSNVRRFLNQGRLPPPNAVRIEELVNYFHYDEPQPAGDDPFSISLEAADCPWNPGHRLVRIGLKGKEIDRSQRPGSNLVFLIDVSGSMKNANKLPLVRTALEMLTQQMTEDDRIAIVTYANEAELKLDSTDGHNKETILKAIRSLQAKGSTNGEAGIQLAYAKAFERRITDGTNRVILCTDGDFNVGVSDDDELMQMVHNYADQSGVFLSIFGFGMGNLKDAKLEKLADKGNGHYGYIDNKAEAHKVFVEEMTGTLYTIAKDLKLQIEFNPYQVGAYRLIGYENRLLAAEDFDDDRKDAGDVGAGHSVTALFEIIPIDKLRQPVELKYQKVSRVKLDAADVEKKQADPNRELLTLFLRYKQPDGKKSVKREYPLSDVSNDSASDTPSENLQWSAAVAAFGMVIRDSQYRGHANYDLVSELALSAQGKDESGRRKEFLKLVKKAQTIQKKLPALTSSTPKEVLPPEPQGKQNTPASENPPFEIGKNVEYWQTHQTNGNDAAKIIQVLKVLYPNMKTKLGGNSGVVMIFAQKSHHEKLAELIPRMTLD